MLIFCSSQPIIFNEAQLKWVTPSVTAAFQNCMFLCSAMKGMYSISSQAKKLESGKLFSLNA